MRFTCAEDNMENEQCAKKPKLDEATTIKEGQAEILVANKNVFYNPVQEFNRDLSIAVLSVFARERNDELLKNSIRKRAKKNENVPEDLKEIGASSGITILEALSATGLRSIRYAKEVEGIKQIVANDISSKAVESIRNNVQHNGVENLITPNREDATLVMYQNRKNRFDAVDLDPYGCPAIFLDGAVQCIDDGGLLMVTATDMAVLAGNSPETCYVKYGAISLKSKACHEIALRILLQNIASHAGRYGRYIVPILSISADFYIRVFVKLYTSQIECKSNATKIGMLYQCVGCETLSTQAFCTKKAKAFKLPSAPSVDQTCKHCKHKQHVGGPIWLDPLHDQTFVSQLLCNLENMSLGTVKRIEGVLSMIHEELDVPLYHTLDRLMSVVRCHTPTMVMFRSAILNAGYKVSYSHANKISIKTDAPNEVLWDIVRAWEKEHPKNKEKLIDNSPALNILNGTSTTNVSFDIHPHANPISRQKHLSRFQQNPTANWGPGTRSRTIIDLETGFEDSKRLKNQNKKCKKTRTDDNENKSPETALNEETS